MKLQIADKNGEEFELIGNQEQRVIDQLLAAGIPRYYETACKDVGPVPHQQHTVVRLRASTREGRGYSGGHDTAARLGWPTSHPAPEAECIASVEGARAGRFTGYHPYTLSFCLVGVEFPNCVCGEHGQAIIPPQTWPTSEMEAASKKAAEIRRKNNADFNAWQDAFNAAKFASATWVRA